MKTQGNLNWILMDSISKASGLTWENNALKWGLHYVNRHSLILYLTLNHRAMHNAYIVTNPSAFLKRAPSLYLERIFQKQLDLRCSEKHSSSQQALKILTLNSFPLAAFALLEISRLTWHRSEKHDQITQYSNPFRPLPLGGGKEGVKAARGNPFEVYLVLSH